MPPVDGRVEPDLLTTSEVKEPSFLSATSVISPSTLLPLKLVRTSSRFCVVHTMSCAAVTLNVIGAIVLYPLGVVVSSLHVIFFIKQDNHNMKGISLPTQ